MSTTEQIRPMNPDAEFFTAELCYINELSNSPADPEASIAQARVPVGVSTRWHRLQGITERYVITDGKGLVEIGDLAPQIVSIGDVMIIPPLCKQRITNIGLTELKFLAICTPRFRQENYEDINDTVISANT